MCGSYSAKILSVAVDVCRLQMLVQTLDSIWVIHLGLTGCVGDGQLECSPYKCMYIPYTCTCIFVHNPGFHLEILSRGGKRGNRQIWGGGNNKSSQIYGSCHYFKVYRAWSMYEYTVGKTLCDMGVQQGEGDVPLPRGAKLKVICANMVSEMLNLRQPFVVKGEHSIYA